MPVAQCTISFSQGTYGWTESYYLDNSSENMIPEMTKLQVLAMKRIPLSGEQTQIDYLKVSKVGVPRDVLLFSYLASDSVPPKGTTGQESDANFTAALIRRQTADNKTFSNLALRGVWRSIIKANTINSFQADWRSAFNAFSAEYIAGAWGFIGKNLTDTKDSPVATLAPNANDNLVYTTVANIFAAGDVGKKRQVFVSGIDGSGTANGLKIVVPSGLNAFTTVNRIPILPYLGGGKVTFKAVQFYAVSLLTVLRAVRRATGRPLYQSRGRSKGLQLA